MTAIKYSQQFKKLDDLQTRDFPDIWLTEIYLVFRGLANIREIDFLEQEITLKGALEIKLKEKL